MWGRDDKDDGLLLLLLLVARGLEHIGDVFTSCQVNDATKYILWDWMKFDQLKDGHKDKDTHNNQPKTRGENGGCKERWHYHQGCERPTFGDDIIVGIRYVD